MRSQGLAAPAMTPVRGFANFPTSGSSCHFLLDIFTTTNFNGIAKHLSNSFVVVVFPKP